MNKSITYIFILLYFVAMIRPVGPVLEYIIFEDYIAEFLCINKDNKELQCNGKCYLMQRLAQQKEQKRQNLPKIALEEYPIGFVELFAFKDKVIPRALSQDNFDYSNTYTYLYSALSFHPPSLIS